ncbi:MAG: hypothetical protein NE328_11430 [Lentisphaeraceae bacterium]|nr:hypothetical protein [Lentisphaeraceae bacterium]
MNGLLSASVAPAKPLVVENIPLIGGEYDGTRVTLKNCAPTITYGSKEDPSIPINYRRLDLDDGNGHKTMLYIDSNMSDMQAFSLLVNGYKLIK